MRKPRLKPSKKFGASTSIILTVAALKNQG